MLQVDIQSCKSSKFLAPSFRISSRPLFPLSHRRPTTASPFLPFDRILSCIDIKMADSTNDAILFEDQFEITAKDHKKYDRAARLSAMSHDRTTTMELDINTELLAINPGDNMEVCLASTLNLDGSRDDDKGWRDLAKADVRTLADAYDYVCYGKVYRFEDGKADKTLWVLSPYIMTFVSNRI